MNKKLLIILIPLILVIIFSFVASLFTNRTTPTATPSPLPFVQLPERRTLFNQLPQEASKAPQLIADQGEGIDMTSAPIQTAISEIKKLQPYLPYHANLTLSNGAQVTVIISPETFQTNPWTLPVQIYGINFQSTPSQSDYHLTKNAFRETAQQIFAWLQTKGVDSNKIYISWGEKAFIQDQAERWLRED